MTWTNDNLVDCSVACRPGEGSAAVSHGSESTEALSTDPPRQ